MGHSQRRRAGIPEVRYCRVEFWHNINCIEMVSKSRGPGRPPNRYKTKPIVFAAPPKLHAYLDDLVEQQEGYGTSKGEAARHLVWDGVHDLISRRLLNKRKDP